MDRVLGVDWVVLVGDILDSVVLVLLLLPVVDFVFDLDLVLKGRQVSGVSSNAEDLGQGNADAIQSMREAPTTHSMLRRAGGCQSCSRRFIRQQQDDGALGNETVVSPKPLSHKVRTEFIGNRCDSGFLYLNGQGSIPSR